MLRSRRFMTIVGGGKVSAHYSGTARGYLRLETSLINGTRGVFSMSRRGGLRHIKDDVWECSYYPFPGAGRKWKRVRASSKREAMIARLKLMEMCQESVPNNLEDLPFEEARKRLEIKCKTDGNSFRTTYHNLLPKFDSLFVKFLAKEFPTIVSLSQFKGLRHILPLTPIPSRQ